MTPGSGHGSLASATWTEIAGLPARSRFVAVPIGSCEQHGPHLPIGTDTVVATALARALAAARPEAVLAAPAVAITASGEHAAFPGTLSIGTEVTTAVLVELGRSADWAAGVVLVNGHGGNSEAVGRAVQRLTAEGRRVLAWWPPPAGSWIDTDRADLHAGWTETSLLLHLAPESVRLERAAVGDTRPLRAIASVLRHQGVDAVSANGVLGDPTGASAGDGERLFAHLVDDLVARFDEWTQTSDR